ncbi:MAG: bifunctional [glutamate--ammonia ligase]-adenylyl-L-tyrosine phosphorylase/[glutamate--ammonia-ligase] adenylyltransferase [Gemmatimonadota bacterium]
MTASARTPPPEPRSPCDRLRDAGVVDTARALALVEEMRKRTGWDDAVWDAVFEAARAAPDPSLFVLNLSKLCDVLAARELRAAFASPRAVPVLAALLGGSEFLADRMARRPEAFRRLFLEGGFERRGSPEALMAEASEAAARCGTEDEIKAALRRMKLREVARIAARDLSRLADLREVTGDLSALASAAIEGAVRFARRQCAERFGAPLVEADGGARRECGFVVMGMGKLGAFELNFSSDVDLIFLYETDRGMTEGGAERKPLTLHEFFVRLSKQAARIVSEVTEDGFVFRVDLRLRPEGTRGDLANSLRSAEIYYESWGQTWERAAMIKARPVAGDIGVGEEFLRIIAPFVYRKHLDFTAIEEIKELKDRIDAALARSRRDAKDLKLGTGGIREIEFFVQAHQLIYGGKNPALRLRGTEETLHALEGQGVVTAQERAGLADAYVFLRSLEHRIQVFRERQTHVLPHGESDLLRLARTMGLADAPALAAETERHTANVRAVYDRLFRGGPREAAAAISTEVRELLESERDGPDVLSRLARMGFSDPAAAARNLAVLRDGPPFTRLSARARRYLDKIAPLVLECVVRTPAPDMALAHTERFLSAVGARTMFYALLHENRKVIEVLVRLFGSSRFLSGFLLRNPQLLDTFLRRDAAPVMKTRSELRRDLREALSACTDFEQELDELRRFKNLETLRIGMHDLGGALSLEESVFQLSALAEVLLGQALDIARREVRKRFGAPTLPDGREAEFCVLGLGKLGAEELSYHADLDIIFVYSGAGESVPAPEAEAAEFRKSSNHEYFARVAQRLISILTTVTREGYVYRLDTRLRPSGNAGPLVSSLAAFERYHQQSAQLWERQALLKCRFVAGDRVFGKRMEETIGRFIYGRPLPRDAAAEIHRLRMRMETELGKERADRLNLKVGRGGIVDVEFAVQYLQLLHGPGDASLRARSTLKALFELRRAGAIGEEEFRTMDEGYRFLRGLELRLRLAHDASIERFDPSALSPQEIDRYRMETERIRAAYLKTLGIPDQPISSSGNSNMG